MGPHVKSQILSLGVHHCMGTARYKMAKQSRPRGICFESVERFVGMTHLEEVTIPIREALSSPCHRARRKKGGGGAKVGRHNSTLQMNACMWRCTCIGSEVMATCHSWGYILFVCGYGPLLWGLGPPSSCDV